METDDEGAGADAVETTTVDRATDLAAPAAVGLRVRDLGTSREFYQRLGFDQVHAVQGDDDSAAMCLLQWPGSGFLIGLAPLDHPHYPLTDHERRTRRGPRGLGVKLSLNVDDLDTAYHTCKQADCDITTEPMDEFWGQRIFTFLDPDGYEWQLGQDTADLTLEQAAEAGRRAWS